MPAFTAFEAAKLFQRRSRWFERVVDHAKSSGVFERLASSPRFKACESLLSEYSPLMFQRGGVSLSPALILSLKSDLGGSKPNHDWLPWKFPVVKRELDVEESAVASSFETTEVHIRRSELSSRIALEAEYRRDWYCVFETLTLGPSHRWQSEYWCREGWYAYVQRLKRAVIGACYPDHDFRKSLLPRGVKLSDCLSYACVLEPHKDGSPHLHAIIFMRNIPRHWRIDPNVGRGRVHPGLAGVPVFSDQRCVSGMSSMWIDRQGYSIGRTFPIAVRRTGDAWHRLGWRWPVRKASSGDYVKIDSSSPAAIGAYLSKYVSKSILERGEVPFDFEVPWRVRATSGFGKAPLVEFLRSCPQWYLRPLCTYSPVMGGYSISISLVRKLAQAERLRRIKSRKSSRLAALAMRYEAPSFHALISEARHSKVGDDGFRGSFHEWQSRPVSPPDDGISSKRWNDACRYLLERFHYVRLVPVRGTD